MRSYEREVARQRALLAATPALTGIVRMATLAANGHNTQPWRFALQAQGITLSPDFTRRTAVVDPDDHHLFVSLGCATENLAIAARATGRSVDVVIQDATAPRIEVALGRAPPIETALYQAIPLRQSTRSVYDGTPVSAADVTLLETAARQEGVSVQILTAPADRDAITQFVVQGNSAQMDDPGFVTELTDWLRFTPDQALKTMDGLFAGSSGNPVMPAWLARRMFDRFFTKYAENTKYAQQIKSSAGIAVFVGDRADPAHWINVGRSFQRFALQATALGIRTAHINQPIEVLSVRPEFSRWLGAPEARPDLVIRFGYAPALPMSLRRPVDQVMI
jgi:nitroreductase